MRSFDAIVCFALLTPFLNGCSSSAAQEPDLDLVSVSGIVTVDGKPLPDADITFKFQGSPPKGFIASGATTDADGRFEIQTGSRPGTVAGKYKVVISRFTMPDGSPPKIDAEAGMDLTQLQRSGQVVQSLPERYNNLEITELTADITENGENEIDFKLSSS